MPYEHLEPQLPEIPERPEPSGYERPPREEFRYVPDAAAKLEERKVEPKKAAKKAAKKDAKKGKKKKD